MANLLERLIGVFPEEEHGDVPGCAYGLGAGLAAEGLLGDVEIGGHRVEDGLSAW